MTFKEEDGGIEVGFFFVILQGVLPILIRKI